MEHRRSNSPNGVIHYWISKKQGGEAPCLVFTHGLTADHSMFEKQVAYFENKLTVIAWDVPLHGLSTPYAEFSYRAAAMELQRILTQEELSKAILVGMSMGGYPSQMFASLFPEQTAGFIALDTTPFGMDYYSKSDLWWLKQAAPMAKWMPARLLRWSMAKSVSATAAAYRKMREMLREQPKARIVEQMEVAYGVFARENQDISLPCPFLILVGERDRTGKVMKYCKAWAEKTGAPLHMIRDAAHFSNGDNPEQVNREIAAFLQTLGIKN